MKLARRATVKILSSYRPTKNIFRTKSRRFILRKRRNSDKKTSDSTKTPTTSLGWRGVLPSRKNTKSVKARSVRTKGGQIKSYKKTRSKVLKRSVGSKYSKYLRLGKVLITKTRWRLKRLTRRTILKKRSQVQPKNLYTRSLPGLRFKTGPNFSNSARRLYPTLDRPSTTWGLGSRRVKRRVRIAKVLPRNYGVHKGSYMLNSQRGLSRAVRFGVSKRDNSSTAYKSAQLVRWEKAKQYKNNYSAPIFKKSLLSPNLSRGARLMFRKKLMLRLYSTQRSLKFKKSRRFIYQSVSGLSYRMRNKLSSIGGGLQANPQTPYIVTAPQKQIGAFIFRNFFMPSERSTSFLHSQYFLFQPIINLRKYNTRVYVNPFTKHSAGDTLIDSAQYYRTLSMQLLKTNLTLASAPNAENSYKPSYLTYSNLTPNQPSLDYAGNQLLYNSIQSYMTYRNSLKQHLARSKTASLILSFETRSTRLNTLPIFLELKRRPFGSDIKPASFLSYATPLANQTRLSFSSFLNPMSMPSIAVWKSKRPYTPLLMRPVTINDRQFKLTKVGPQVEPLPGIKPSQEFEAVIKRFQLQTKYTITSRIAGMYLKLLCGNTLPSLVLRYKPSATEAGSSLLNNLMPAPFRAYTSFIRRPRSAQRKKRKFRFRRWGKRFPKFVTHRFPLKSLKKRTRKCRFRGRKFFSILRAPFRFKQRRVHLNLQQRHILSDFGQSRLSPDQLISSRVVTGFKKHLIPNNHLNGTREYSRSSTKVRLFGTQKLLNYSHPQLLIMSLLNPFLLKTLLSSFSMVVSNTDMAYAGSTLPKVNYTWHLISKFTSSLNLLISKLQQKTSDRGSQISKITTHSNLLPHKSFASTITKYVSSLHLHNKIREDFVPLYFHTLVRFVEAATGKRFVLQFYPFLHQSIPLMTLIRYKQWIPKMKMYERRLGHKFFFEESLHLMHLSFVLRDSVLFSSWLKTMIRRISFWKTRLIFRFLRYLFINFFSSIMPELRVRGIKIKLKGKISVGGNSRKRTIFFRSGESSYSRVDLRVSHHKQTIGTFTGVQGLQLWIFY